MYLLQDFQIQWEMTVSHLFKLFMDALYIYQYPLVLEVIGKDGMEESSINTIQVRNIECACYISYFGIIIHDLLASSG